MRDYLILTVVMGAIALTLCMWFERAMTQAIGDIIEATVMED